MRAVVLVLAVVLLGSLAPLAHVGGQAPNIEIAVKSVRASYTSEAWKDDAPLASGIKQGMTPPVSVGPFQVYENPYADPRSPHQGPTKNYWGYRADVALALVDASGKDAQPGTGQFYVEAKLRTANGDIPAKLTKTGATTFIATFDLDGEDGKDFPPLPTSGGTLMLEAWQVAGMPVATTQKLGATTVPLPASDVFVDRIADLLPDSVIPGYADAAPGNATPVLPRLVDPTRAFTANFTFATKNASAVVDIVAGTNVREAFNGTTGPTGRVAVTFEPSAALGGATNGMLLLEAHLAGGAPPTSGLPPLGSTILALPVSAHKSAITAVTFTPRSVGPQNLTQGDTVEVTTSDPDAAPPQSGATSGTLFVLKGGNVLGSANDLPASFASGTDRTADFQADLVRSHHLASYEMLTILTDSSGNFYSMASANRGYSIDVDDTGARAGAPSTLRLTVRNLDDNFDAKVTEGLALRVDFAVSGLSGGNDTKDSATIPERGTKTFDVPFTPHVEGVDHFTLVSSAGELTTSASPLIRVAPAPNAIRDFLKSIPFPDVALTALAALGATVLVARRARSL